MITPQVRKVAPVCRVCGSDRKLIRGDGPAVCQPCISEAGVMAQATVRRNDTPESDHQNREGQWPA